MDFATTLRAFMTRARCTNSELARLTGISIHTLEYWTAGRVRRPHFVTDLLRIARALSLDASDTSTLLSAAGHPALSALQAQAQQSGDQELNTLLSFWERSEAQPDSVPNVPPSLVARHQLRPPVADFTGRRQEVDQLAATLQAAVRAGVGIAISGVQGMGGIGKTELAYAVAHRLRDVFPDAQIVVPLYGSSATPLTTVQAIQKVIRAFNPDAHLPEDLSTLEELYRSVLHDQRVLILADDAAEAAQVRALLPPDGSALLLTSRQRFMLEGMLPIQLEQLDEGSATALLRRLAPRLDVEEAQALAQRCGYLPLALRVCGSMLHTTPALSVANYLAGLADERRRLDLLRDPNDAELDVAATLTQSYTRLDKPAQAVFRQLGVLVADFTLPLARAVVETSVDVETTLFMLLRRNLVMYDAQYDRWRLHDLMRDLARQQLEAMGEAGIAQWRYARAVVAIAQDIQDQYLAGSEQALVALSRFDAERAHIDAGLHWAQLHAEMPAGDQLLLDIARATCYIGRLRYDWRHKRIPLWESVRTAAQQLGNLLGEAQALRELGITYKNLGELRTAIVCHGQHLAIARQIGDRHEEACALGNLGITYSHLGELYTAIDYHEQTLAITREIGDRYNEGIVLNSLGFTYSNLGEPTKALSYYEQDLAIAREIGDRHGEGITLSNLGKSYRNLGDLYTAIRYQEQALAIVREFGDRHTECFILGYLGDNYTDLGELPKAISYHQQSLAIAREIGDRLRKGITLGILGYIYTSLGDTQRAIATCKEALTIRQEIGDRRGEGYALSYLAHAQAIQGDIAQASSAYTQARTCFEEVGDRRGEAECNWLFGLALAKQGEHDRALPLLRAALVYEQEVGHAKAADHAALVARLEAGEDLSAELPPIARQRAVGKDSDALPNIFHHITAT
jgi:tetratricopeptide (TPR) repeat protein/transcriptional regulator with XRE-family HTH domain